MRNLVGPASLGLLKACNLLCCNSQRQAPMHHVLNTSCLHCDTCHPACWRGEGEGVHRGCGAAAVACKWAARQIAGACCGWDTALLEAEQMCKILISFR